MRFNILKDNIVINTIVGSEAFVSAYCESTGLTYKADEAAEPQPESPTQLDRIEAQATYTAMMTDTLLEEV